MRKQSYIQVDQTLINTEDSREFSRLQRTVGLKKKGYSIDESLKANKPLAGVRITFYNKRRSVVIEKKAIEFYNPTWKSTLTKRQVVELFRTKCEDLKLHHTKGKEERFSDYCNKFSINGKVILSDVRIRLSNRQEFPLTHQRL